MSTMSRLLLARGGCGLLQPLSLLVGRRRGCRLARRGGLQVAAFWPQSGGKRCAAPCSLQGFTRRSAATVPRQCVC